MVIILISLTLSAIANILLLIYFFSNLSSNSNEEPKISVKSPEKDYDPLNPVWEAEINGVRTRFRKMYNGDIENHEKTLEEAKAAFHKFKYIGSGDVRYLDGKLFPNKKYMHFFTNMDGTSHRTYNN